MKRLTRSRSKALLLAGSLIAVAILLLQFTSPEIPNPPVTGPLAGPDSVTTIFQHACYDCHSNESNIRWYDKVAPVSWKVAADVAEARGHLNFSQWDSLSHGEQLSKLWYIVNMVDQGRMPLPSYTAVHPSARVTDEEINTLKRYVTALTNKPKPTVIKPVAHTTAKPSAKQAAPTSINGIAYFDDYKNWKVIASTNRFDNGTMRLIYGNDIAVKALEKNTINPWPDGAKIVKVVWDKQPVDSVGNVHAGKFNNVQLMIRDSKKFRETGGWGYARFNTPQLIPYGKAITFAVECYQCHKLASSNGFVFDIPTKE
ncbi:heme-binding domain-containing protein [Fulvivirgaceae bacterium PWU5]|uniref:Heme-binding domain-containing protein n=1 Tax=Dawidia cretensis TaxID=2782350 RepID=A0AAP2DZ56_9BACT|nr:heme-binding domain-containing protein [Dawidia cretensis]MBT1709996.1 heme-binding domain-containing protein [Dawidia cretensis]